MAVTAAALSARLGATAEDAAQVDRSLALAELLVTNLIAEEGARPGVIVPPAVRDEAVLRCAVDAFNRAQAPNGVLMSAIDETGDGSSAVLRTPADPLHSARLVLSQYVSPLGFA